jgi:hypothetical protein
MRKGALHGGGLRLRLPGEIRICDVGLDISRAVAAGMSGTGGINSSTVHTISSIEDVARGVCARSVV